MMYMHYQQYLAHLVRAEQAGFKALSQKQFIRTVAHIEGPLAPR